MHRHFGALVLAVSTLVAGSASAEPLTFSQALERAVANSPSLDARNLGVAAAQTAAGVAGTRPDPRLTFGLDNLPLTGPMAGSLNGDEMTMARVGVMQDLPSSAQRRAERAVAQADISAAQADQAMELREVRSATALAWIDAYYAERRLASLDSVMQALAPLWTTTSSGVAAGTTRPAASLAPIQMRAKLDDQRSELAAALSRAKSQLARWAADPAATTTGQPPSMEIDEAALRAGLDDQPIFKAYRSANDRAQANLDLALAAKRPDWSVEASYDRRDPKLGDMVSVGTSVRLPLFAASRQDPLIAARRTDVQRVAAERESARRALLAQFQADLADHVMHHDQWLRSRDVVRPAAQQQADLETASYGAGRAALSDVLSAFSDLANANLEALEREAAVARDAVRITLTYGSQAQ